MKKAHDILIICWKSLWQNTIAPHSKSLGEIRNPGIYINIIEAIYSKPKAYIKLSGEKPEAIPLKSRTRQGYTLLPYLLNIVLKVLAKAIRQQKIKEIQIRKEEVKVSLFTHGIIVYISNHQKSSWELQKLINNLSKAAGYKINSNKQLAFLYINDK